MTKPNQHSVSRTILITGGASGIGLGLAQQLGASGHKIIIADMNLDAANNAVDELGAQGISARAVMLDVTDTQQVAALPDILAPDQHVAKLEDFPAQKWQQLIDIMLVAPAMLTQAFLPGMRSKNYGRIINIGSVHSLIASPFKSAYVAAKHGLLGFSKTIALETGDCDVTINTLCPAYVKTPLVEKQIAAQAKEHGMSEEDVINKIMLEPMPKKSFIHIDELVSSAAFLMEHSARNITAQTIVIDGGWTAR